MSEQECAFDDWQLEAEVIEEKVADDTKSQSKQVKEFNDKTATQAKVDCQDKLIDWNQYHLGIIQKYQKMTSQQFQDIFQNSQMSKTQTRQIQQIKVHLTDEDNFNQLSKQIAIKFKIQAQRETGNLLPHNQILTFFQEFILYLYPVLEWKNLDLVKDKIKIVKKNKKQEQIKAKKIKEKQERNRRVHKQQQTIFLHNIGEIQSINISNTNVLPESKNIDQQF